MNKFMIYDLRIKNFRKERGFSMVELIITVFILSFGIVSVYGAFTNIIIAGHNISSRLIAVYLAKEGMEIARNIRDGNFVNNEIWDKDIKDCEKGCQADYKTGTSKETSLNKLKRYDDNKFLSLNTDGFYSYDSGVVSKFKRKITITKPLKKESYKNDVLKIAVEVFWDYSGKKFSFATEGYLYNWY